MWLNKKSIKYLVGALGISAALVLLDSVFLEKYFFRIKKITIGDRETGKPISVILVTDLHLKDFLSPHHRRLAAKINQLNPDLLLIAGDTLDTFGKLETVAGFFKLINRDIKKIAIPGNHDHKAKASQGSLTGLGNIYANNNCDFLINKTNIYNIHGSRVAITGLDDCIEGRGNLHSAVAKTGHEQNHILLVHSPLQQESVIKQLEEINADRSPEEQLAVQYIFAGHNHGGQVRLPGYVPVLPEMSGDYVNGWYNDRPPYLYLSKGFGTSAVPFRFFARSEIILFTYFVR